MKARIFLAVLVPKKIQERIENKLYPALHKFRNELKIVPSENLHVTLRFLGETPEKKIRELKQQLIPLEKNRPFEMRLEKTGSFNNRVVWIRIQKGQEELKSLCRQIRETLFLEEEPFAGHVTLGRNKSLSKKQMEELVRELNEIPFQESFSVHSVHLMQSRLTAAGPEYASVQKWEFKSKKYSKELK